MQSRRLAACADFVAGGGILCDVGTDHAQLPVYIVSSGICEKAYACDIADGPLKSAEKSVSRAGLSDKIKLIKSDGLDSVPPEGISDVVIAGMGGELIRDILSRAEWLKNGVNLVLQPNTRENELVNWLCENGYEIKGKKACEDGRFVYPIFNVSYTGRVQRLSELDHIVMGLDLSDEDSIKYVKKQASRLETAAKGMLEAKNELSKEEAAKLLELSKRLFELVHSKE